jgi:periplasmic protein TonB
VTPLRQDVHLEPGIGLAIAAALHVALFLVVGSFEAREPALELIEFEVAELPLEEPEVKPEEPEEEPELPEEEPELPEEPEPPEIPEPPPPPEPPKPRPKPKGEPPPEPTPPDDPPALPPPTRIELPPDQTIPTGPSGVKVHTGDRTQPGRTQGSAGGSPQGRPGGTGREGGSAQGKGDAEPAWAPKGDLYVSRLPHTVHVPEISCPATRELGISGTVVLMVQVRRDGSIRNVRVAKGIGHGCDAVAVKALRKAKFKPAVATDGKPTDYELRYEYEFELDR